VALPPFLQQLEKLPGSLELQRIVFHELPELTQIVIAVLCS
jgi:hypothetical protein